MQQTKISCLLRCLKTQSCETVVYRKTRACSLHKRKQDVSIDTEVDRKKIGKKIHKVYSKLNRCESWSPWEVKKEADGNVVWTARTCLAVKHVLKYKVVDMDNNAYTDWEAKAICEKFSSKSLLPSKHMTMASKNINKLLGVEEFFVGLKLDSATRTFKGLGLVLDSHSPLWRNHTEGTPPDEPQLSGNEYCVTKREEGLSDVKCDTKHTVVCELEVKTSVETDFC